VSLCSLCFQVLRDHTGLYVTFPKAGVAHRATALLGSKQLGFQSVTLTVHPPPVYEPVIEKTHWDADELVAAAQEIVIRELRVLLGKDIADRLVGQDLKKLVVEERSKGASASAIQKELARPLEKKGLKGLSFKKKKEVVEQEKEELDEMDVEEKEEAEVEAEMELEQEDEEEEVERPKKKRKMEAVKTQRRVIDDEDIESEDEDESDVARVAAINADIAARKRAVSEDREEEDEPVKKKHKIHEIASGKGKQAKKAKGKKGTAKHTEMVEDILFTDTERFASLAVTKLHLASTIDGSSATPSRSPSPQPKRKRRAPTPPPPPAPSPPPDPVELGLCEDDEDLYFAKLALAGEIPNDEKPSAPPSSSDVPTFRKHLTCSARTEGYYKITHAEKAAYVAQYQARAATAGAAPPIIDEAPMQHVTSSRSNRANARRRAQGLEEINQVQRAVALSKGETAASELTFKFNQLQTRKKHLRFARSPIHDWGLYAMEKISRGEMVIEYVGEVIRAQVADKREKAYERQGIGSSYLFRIDEDLVVDATKKGNLGCVCSASCLGLLLTIFLITHIQPSDQSLLRSQLHGENHYD
jgi:histone-lysine N-methyltransferase SETD1